MSFPLLQLTQVDDMIYNIEHRKNNKPNKCNNESISPVPIAIPCNKLYGNATVKIIQGIQITKFNIVCEIYPRVCVTHSAVLK